MCTAPFKYSKRHEDERRRHGYGYAFTSGRGRDAIRVRQGCLGDLLAYVKMREGPDQEGLGYHPH